MFAERLLTVSTSRLFHVTLSTSKVAPLISRLPQCERQNRRSYAVFPPTFQKPTTRKEELAKPLDENDPRGFMPILPAARDECPHVLSDPLVNRLIKMLMKGGRKALARRIVLDAFEKIKRIQLKKYWTAQTDEERANIECDPVVIYHAALKNISPILWLSPVPRGGIIYQVPMPISATRSRFRGLQFIRDAARDRERHRDRPDFHADDKLATDLVDAYYNTGVLIKKKQDLYRVCEANKTYASYRWQK